MTSAPPEPKLISSLQFASLYVGDLHPDCGEATLYEAFSEAGNVASCRVCRDSVTRKSLGYGYVNYYAVEDAERALEELNHMSIKGKPCRVMWSQRDPEKRRNTASNVFVKGLDPTIDSKALHDTFSIFGHILSCKVAMNEGGKSRGYGFVHYESEDAAKMAIEKVNGMKIGDSQVFVGPFLKREELDVASAEEYTNLYVKNLPPKWDEAKLSTVFGEFGEVASSVILKTDEGKRFALVNFKTSAAAKAAVADLHRKDMRSEEGVEDKPVEKKEEEKPAEEKDEAKPDEKQGEDKVGEKKDDEQADSKKEEEHPAYLLYVQRAQTRTERKAALDEERRKKKGAGKGLKSGYRLCVKNIPEDAKEDELKEFFSPHGTVMAVILRQDESGKSKNVGFVIMSTLAEATKCIEEVNGRELKEKTLQVIMSERRRRGPDGEDLEEQRPDGKGKKGKGKGKSAGKGKDAKGDHAGPAGAPAPPGAFPCYAARPMGFHPHAPPPLGGFPSGHPGMPPMGFPCSLPPRPGGPAYSLPPAHAAAAAAGKGVPPPIAFPGFPGHRPPYPFPPAPYPGFPPPMLPGMPRPHMPGMPPSPVAPSLPPPLSKEALDKLPMQQQKQLLGERLYALNFRHRPELAGKLTGMMLELKNEEILSLLQNEDRLAHKIGEAIKVLEKT
eukprot:TRINITY_DN2921_c0_g1_i2.p1 TRINITY_DN2921_c0_g1~~TRINITY_DN2921_c0_g1_i2.p1  ORF type:complete len:669 (+),score=154.44 TRINITY_DN2921_c0_g1_i2:92-2098(+)